jgi:hypothetical protein
MCLKRARAILRYHLPPFIPSARAVARALFCVPSREIQALSGNRFEVLQAAIEHDKWRDDCRRSPDGVADAVSAKSHLGREQLECVNSKQDRDLNINRDDQQETDREQAACLVHEGIDHAKSDRSQGPRQ